MTTTPDSRHSRQPSHRDIFPVRSCREKRRALTRKTRHQVLGPPRISGCCFASESRIACNTLHSAHGSRCTRCTRRTDWAPLSLSHFHAPLPRLKSMLGTMITSALVSTGTGRRMLSSSPLVCLLTRSAHPTLSTHAAPTKRQSLSKMTEQMPTEMCATLSSALHQDESLHRQ